MWTGFFFLGRPGEYCAARSGNKYFRLSDVQLLNHGHNLDLWSTPEETLRRSTDAHLNFSDQKNHHRGEKVGQKASGHPTASPTVAIADQVCHLRAHGATPATPLCAFKEGTTWFVVTSTMITALLREAVAACPECGITPADVSARSLRASGAMAMLCDGLDTDHIKLFGRWRSDELLTYLHVQAEPVYRDVSARMLRGGVYNLVPGTQAHAAFTAQPDSLYH